MRKLNIIIGMAVICAIASWMLSPVPTFAQRGSTSIKASAHVVGLVVGKPVRSEKNVVLGTVENIVLNDTGCAQYLIVSGTFSGARARLFPMPWSVIARTAPDAIFIRVDEQFLAKAPSFEVNRWPNFSQPEWQTKIKTFYRAGASVTGPGMEERPGAVRPEGAPKAQKRWERPATEGKATPEEKAKSKALQERERKGKASEMGANQPSKPKESDIRSRERIQPKERQIMQRTPGTMERGQPQMMEKGPSHMERGRSEMKGQVKPEKGAPAQGAVPVEPGPSSEKIK